MLLPERNIFLILIPTGLHCTGYVIYSTCTFQSYHVSSFYVSPLGRWNTNVPSPIILWTQGLYCWRDSNPALCTHQVQSFITVYTLLGISMRKIFLSGRSITQKGTTGNTSPDDATQWYPSWRDPPGPPLCILLSAIVPSLYPTPLSGVLNVAWLCDLGQVTCSGPQCNLLNK